MFRPLCVVATDHSKPTWKCLLQGLKNLPQFAASVTCVCVGGGGGGTLTPLTYL